MRRIVRHRVVGLDDQFDEGPPVGRDPAGQHVAVGVGGIGDDALGQDLAGPRRRYGGWPVSLPCGRSRAATARSSWSPRPGALGGERGNKAVRSRCDGAGGVSNRANVDGSEYEELEGSNGAGAAGSGRYASVQKPGSGDPR